MPHRGKINHAKEHIINEVKKYATQKKLLLELSNINTIDEIKLQNKSMDELVSIYNNTLNNMHKFSNQIAILRDYFVKNINWKYLLILRVNIYFYKRFSLLLSTYYFSDFFIN
jgi:hypothetical protein